MAEASLQPLPAGVLFPLLKALDPAKLKKSQSRGRVAAADAAVFKAAVDAAATSRTARQFAKRLGNGNGAGAAAAAPLTITELTVQYSGGYTIVTIGYSNGHTEIHAFPT